MSAVNLFFDVRQSPNGASHAAHVEAILDICERVDRIPNVTSSADFPEHHGFQDGYIQSPGSTPEPPTRLQSLVAGSTDLDQTWKDVAPFCMYESNTYYELQLVEWSRRTGAVTIQPLTCGIDPAIGWRSIELIEREVIPALNAG